MKQDHWSWKNNSPCLANQSHRSKHYFANNLYAREISIPKGIVLTEKNKTEHLCVLSKGKVSVWTDEGMKTKNVFSGSSIRDQARFTLTKDSVWINFHHNPTNEKDPEKKLRKFLSLILLKN